MSEQKSFFEQNMEMWQKWSNAYMDTMFKMMDKGMDQTSAVQKQLNQAVNAAVSAQFEATLTALKALERQVELLSEKVDKLSQKQ